MPFTVTGDPAADLQALALLGGRMRELQRTFFKRRDPTALREAKDAERRFDEALDAVAAGGGRQPGLFGDAD